MSPAGREGEDDQQDTYPCGGLNTISTERTQFPLSGGPIQLEMGHDHSEVQVNIAIGNDAVDGTAFNVNVVPIFQEEGLGEFCIDGLAIPPGLNLQDGDNATIQVITNGDPQGGLYNCADITLSSSAQPGQCNNGTGVRAVPFTGSNMNANGSDASTANEASGAAASATPTGGAAGSNGLVTASAGFLSAVLVGLWL